MTVDGESPFQANTSPCFNEDVVLAILRDDADCANDTVVTGFSGGRTRVGVRPIPRRLARRRISGTVNTRE
jgi:hypothetical protein